MKRGLLLGGAVLVALAAAVPLWMALDGDGERRSAALVEPTAGGLDVGKLTITGQMSGTHVIPVRSYSWGVTVPRSVSTGQASGQPRYEWLEVIKPIDATSPVVMRMLVNNESLTSAKLELQAPTQTSSVPTTYLTYTFTNASFAEWDDTTTETVKLTFASASVVLPKAARPTADKQVIGQMTVPSISATPVPIVGFATGLRSPRDPASGLPTGKRVHKPVVVRRPIDALSAVFMTKAGQNALLGTITIELRRVNNGILETYAKYTYTNAAPAAVVDAGAAGSPFATQELQFVYSKVEFEVGPVMAADDWEAPVA